MLLLEQRQIGNKLLAIRKRRGLTQAEIAEAAGLSDRTYADIECGTVNMRVETLLRICGALRITPNDILIEDTESFVKQEDILQRLSTCSPERRDTALQLLNVYLHSID